MSNNYDTKSNIVGDDSKDNETHPEPPPPYTPPEQGGGGSSNTNSSRAVPYGGGATEETPLLNQQSPTSPQQPTGYAPTPNLQPNLQFPPTDATPLQALRDKPALTACPHCQQVAWSTTEHEIGCCSFLSCLGLLAVGCTAICSFIPFFVSI
jgi:hypothetical protein